VTLHESDNWIRIHPIEERALSSPNELIDALVTAPAPTQAQENDLR
jgi:hypothetical protein